MTGEKRIWQEQSPNNLVFREAIPHTQQHVAQPCWCQALELSPSHRYIQNTIKQAATWRDTYFSSSIFPVDSVSKQANAFLITSSGSDPEGWALIMSAHTAYQQVFLQITWETLWNSLSRALQTSSPPEIHLLGFALSRMSKLTIELKVRVENSSISSTKWVENTAEVIFVDEFIVVLIDKVEGLFERLQLEQNSQNLFEFSDLVLVKHREDVRRCSLSSGLFNFPSNLSSVRTWIGKSIEFTLPEAIFFGRQWGLTNLCFKLQLCCTGKSKDVDAQILHLEGNWAHQDAQKTANEAHYLHCMGSSPAPHNSGNTELCSSPNTKLCHTPRHVMSAPQRNGKQYTSRLQEHWTANRCYLFVPCPRGYGILSRNGVMSGLYTFDS